MSLSPCSGNSPPVHRKFSVSVTCNAINGNYFPVKVPSFEQKSKSLKLTPFEKELKKWKPLTPLEPGQKYPLTEKRTFAWNNGLFQIKDFQMLNIVAIWKPCILILYNEPTGTKKQKLDANKMQIVLEPCERSKLVSTKGFSKFRVDKVKKSHKAIYFKSEIPSLFEKFSAGMTMVAKKIATPHEMAQLKEEAYYVSQWHINKREDGFFWRCLKCGKFFESELTFCVHTKTKMSSKSKLDDWKEIYVDNGKATIEDKAVLRLHRPFTEHVSYTINDPKTLGTPKGCWDSLRKGCEKWNYYKPRGQSIQRMRSNFLNHTVHSDLTYKYLIYLYILEDVKTSRMANGWYDERDFLHAPHMTENQFHIQRGSMIN